MKNKRIHFGLFFLFVFFFAVRSENDKSIVCYRSGLWELAKVSLQQALQLNRIDNPMYDYYLGRIAFATDNRDSAAYYFKSGLNIDPDNPYLQIGEGMLLYKSDPQAAKSCFKKAVDKKGVDLQSVNAELLSALIVLGSPEYKELLEKLKKDNENSPVLYVAEGDALVYDKKYGDALTAYEQAIYFDPLCVEAYVKSANIYKVMNIQLAIDLMNKLLIAKPACDIAYHELGELYFQEGKFDEAENNFLKFVESNPSLSKSDLAHYSTILFYNKKYTETKALLDKALSVYPDELVLNRIKMYLLASDSITDASLSHAAGFMQKYPKEQYIVLDYVYYGRILKGLKNYEKAIDAYNSAVALEPENSAYCRELASLYEADNKYKDALNVYDKMFRLHKDKMKANDYLVYGKANYFAVESLKNTPDSVICKSLLMKADTLFSQVVQLLPDNYLGYFWRARTLSLIDYETTQGLAKPDYEKVLAILEPEGKDKNKLVECYNYLGYYYYVVQNKSESLNYWKKTLALDPDNEMAKKAIAGIGKEL